MNIIKTDQIVPSLFQETIQVMKLDDNDICSFIDLPKGWSYVESKVRCPYHTRVLNNENDIENSREKI